MATWNRVAIEAWHILIPQSDRYGGFNDDGYFVTATIPPSYQNCTQEGNLQGCIVKDDQLQEQCSGERTGELDFQILEIFTDMIIIKLDS